MTNTDIDWRKDIEIKGKANKNREPPKWNYRSETIDKQFQRLQERFPKAKLDYWGNHPDGTTLIQIPDFPLVKGYNKSQTRLAFLLPIGFPQASPAHFYVDPELRLEAGGWLGYSHGEEYLDEDWWQRILIYPNLWSPNHDTIFTFAMVAKVRLSKLI